MSGGEGEEDPRAGGGHAYEVVSSRTEFEGRILRLHVDTLTMPDGGTADREICDHDDAVAVVALDADDRIALVRQYRPAVRERLWELPAGLCDVAGESPRDAAARELVEEAGTEAARWREITSILPSPGFSTEKVTVFLASGLTDVGRPDRPHEESEIELRWAPLEAVVAEILDGAIVNGIAVAGILATRAALGR